VAYLDHARAGSLIPKFSKSDAEEVASYVGRLFDHDAERPALLRLLLWEALEYGPEPVAGEADRARRDYSANIEALTDAPRAGRIVERRAGEAQPASLRVGQLAVRGSAGQADARGRPGLSNGSDGLPSTPPLC
jgi:hypothetical protein